jgi:hypothetical protein
MVYLLIDDSSSVIRIHIPKEVKGSVDIPNLQIGTLVDCIGQLKIGPDGIRHVVAYA